MFGLRIGDHPQACVTPRPIPLLREVIRAPHTAVTTATTYGNRAYLAASFFDQIIRKYEGTRLGQQELLGKLIPRASRATFRGTRRYGKRHHHRPSSFRRRAVSGCGHCRDDLLRRRHRFWRLRLGELRRRAVVDLQERA
jgi:phage terminase large subunit-like protein